VHSARSIGASIPASWAIRRAPMSSRARRATAPQHCIGGPRRRPRVVAVDGLSGIEDLLIHVVARDADDLYRSAGLILDINGVERTNTSLVRRDLIDLRLTQLLPKAGG
jgi:DNA-binding Lrp family transcriptional regulator